MSQPRQNIRALIVDDELLARRAIRLLIQNDPEIMIIGECINGFEAVKAISNDAPDLIFLDVQMPEMNGFEVLKATGIDAVPAIVFVTAYDQYALKAFEVNALDYLLKPFEDERFEKTLLRAKEQVRQKNARRINQQLSSLLDHYDARLQQSDQTAEPSGKPKYLQRLAIKSGGRIYFLKAEEIDWIEAADQYVLLHVGTKSHLTRESLSNLENQLDPERFFRIHRSTIVNLERVKEMQPNTHGDSAVTLRDGTKLKLSRNRREEFQESLIHLR